MSKVAIIYYSTYGHTLELAKQEAAGLEEAGVQVDIYQIPETLSPEVLQKMGAPPKPVDIPVATVEILSQYDGFLFGLSTRFGSYPAQFKSFWDATGGLWAQGTLYGKYVGLFLTTGTLGGGQETLARNTISNFVHHGLIYVPLGYKEVFGDLTSFEEVHGGSPWGAGALAGADGSRLPSDLEKKIAFTQGKSFGLVVNRAVSGPSKTSASTSIPSSTTKTNTPSNTAEPNSSKPVADATAATTTAAPNTTTAAPTSAPAPTQKAAANTTPTRGGAEKPTEKKDKKFGCCLVM